MEFTPEGIANFLLAAVPYLLIVLIGAYVIMGAVFDYHWRRYGIGLIRITVLRSSYLVIGLILVAVIIVAYASL